MAMIMLLQVYLRETQIIPISIFFQTSIWRGPLHQMALVGVLTPLVRKRQILEQVRVLSRLAAVRLFIFQLLEGMESLWPQQQLERHSKPAFPFQAQAERNSKNTFSL